MQEKTVLLRAFWNRCAFTASAAEPSWRKCFPFFSVPACSALNLRFHWRDFSKTSHNLRGQRLPSLTAQSPADLRQLGTISTSWGLAWEPWVVFDALIPRETRLILESSPSSGQLSAWGRVHCFTKFQWTRAVLGRNVCSRFFESGFPWEGKGEDNLIILKCDFLAELFIAPSASVASGVLSGEMPLKLITSMPPSLSRGTLFPFFFRLLGELCRLNRSACSFTKILRWAALRFGSMSKVFSFSFVLSQHRILAEMLWSFFLSVTLHDSDYQINL